MALLGWQGIVHVVKCTAAILFRMVDWNGAQNKAPMQVTFDVMSNSPCVSQGIQRSLEGESSRLSEVTKGFFPGTPSINLLGLSEYCRIIVNYYYDC